MPNRFLLTPGEPAGVGPDVVIRMTQEDWPAELIVIADPDLLLQRAKLMGLPLQLEPCDWEAAPKAHVKGTLKISPILLNDTVTPGQLNPKHAHYVIQTLAHAAMLCLNKQADGVVTGPVHKGVINEAGIAFTGHTEFFAKAAGVQQTVMLFLADDAKVALATTHVPLAEVSSVLTATHLRTVLEVLIKGLRQLFQLERPRIAVCGLNPHAGEGGYLGREEIEVMAPVLAACQSLNAELLGPLSADTAFTPAHLKTVDAVLAMYHDQALPVVKYMSFGHAVNVTLGLPFVRTSVDHGTAIDIAGTPLVDAGSMKAALTWAIRLATSQK